ncbi:hypothetical protein [Pectobacterium aquaticum]|nr:hypothetical protein [Pectobacterium aquaticum]PLY38774.1 hypothetical protein F164LOC_02900 [Pectobacterium carotovorum]RRN95961.1 hypothetical protein DMB79_011245 [Pectobacterium aquaticum]RRO03070.1 hypothetical protein DMB83_007185 [Pectobacterium aquaticum]RRO10913.1 hypothetical protein DMB85_004055 [Pectobacterium aquaticum]
MSWESSIPYYRIINEYVKSQLGGLHSANKGKEVVNRIILGCTEIPLLISAQDAEVPLFDTSRLHAIAAAKFALNQS